MLAEDLSPEEWSRIHGYFLDLFPELPSSGTWRPAYEASSGNFGDIYRDARAAALRSRAAVESLVETRASRKAWPRGRYEAKFWLRARWGEAARAAGELAGEATGSASRDVRSEAVRKAKVWLLYTNWDERSASRWLQENLGDYVHFCSYKGPDEIYVEYRKWLEDLERGHFRDW